MLAYINNIVSTIGLKWAANWNFQDWLTVGGGGLPIFQTPHEVPLTTLKSTKNILTNFTKSPNLFTRGFQKGDEHFFYEGVPKSSFYQNHHHHYHHHDPLLVQEALHQLYFHSNQILTVKLLKGTFSCLTPQQILNWSFLFGRGISFSCNEASLTQSVWLAALSPIISQCEPHFTPLTFHCTLLCTSPPPSERAPPSGFTPRPGRYAHREKHTSMKFILSRLYECKRTYHLHNKTMIAQTRLLVSLLLDSVYKSWVNKVQYMWVYCRLQHFA